MSDASDSGDGTADTKDGSGCKGGGGNCGGKGSCGCGGDGKCGDDCSCKSGDENDIGGDCSHHDHDHDHNEEEALGTAEVLSGAIYEARTGLRSNIADLLEVLLVSEIFVPLAEDIPEAPDDEKMELEGDLTFRPHMLVHEDGNVFAVAYSEPYLVEPIRRALDWGTSGGDLKFVQLPATVALDLGQSSFDGVEVRGLVLNPGDDSELVLLRDEVGSLLAGKPLPLVGYVEQLGPGSEEETQVIEGADPPPPALVEALAEATSAEEDVSSFAVRTTFNPERDREPHLTIALVVPGSEADREGIAERVMEKAAPHVPAPGYADVVFEAASN